MAGMEITQEHLRPGRYAIETSSVKFRTRHLFGLLPVRGEFTVRAGTVDVATPLADSSVRVEIDAASMSTGNDRRDEDVRSPRFLDTARHPVITFVSERVEETAVTGTLTVHGVDRPLTLAITGSDATRDGFTVRATTSVDRTEFGVTAAPGMAGRRLDVSLEITCVRA